MYVSQSKNHRRPPFTIFDCFSCSYSFHISVSICFVSSLVVFFVVFKSSENAIIIIVIMNVCVEVIKDYALCELHMVQ